MNVQYACEFFGDSVGWLVKDYGRRTINLNQLQKILIGDTNEAVKFAQMLWGN